MNIIGNSLTSLASSFNAHQDITKAKTVVAFSEAYIPSPLKSSIVSLGIVSTKLGPRITTENNGTYTVTFNRPLEIKYKLTVYSPHENGGNGCTAVFDGCIDCLVRFLGLIITEAGCGEISYSPTVGATVLNGYFILTSTVADNT